MRRKSCLLLGLSIMALAAAGCNPVSGVKRGFQELKGAEAKVAVIDDVGSGELAAVSAVRVDRVVSDIGPLVPQEFVVATASQLRTELSGMRSGGAGGPALVSAKITYYQTGGTVRTLLGNEKMAIMHVSIVSDKGGQLGEFLVVVSSEALRTTDNELASALARGVAKYLKAAMPRTE